MNMKKLTISATTLALAATMSFALPRKAAEITVSGYTGGSTLANFPVLVRISPERILGFSYADCAADGRDIAFEDAQGNALDREIDTWDPNGESLVWVRMPSMAANTTFRMTYGDANVSAQPPCQTNGAVWSAAGYVGVWHFGEDYGTAFDSTTNALHGAVDASYDQTCIAANDAKVGKSRYVSTSRTSATSTSATPSPYPAGTSSTPASHSPAARALIFSPARQSGIPLRTAGMSCSNGRPTATRPRRHLA